MVLPENFHLFSEAVQMKYLDVMALQAGAQPVRSYVILYHLLLITAIIFR